MVNWDNFDHASLFFFIGSNMLWARSNLFESSSDWPEIPLHKILCGNSYLGLKEIWMMKRVFYKLVLISCEYVVEKNRNWPENEPHQISSVYLEEEDSSVCWERISKQCALVLTNLRTEERDVWKKWREMLSSQGSIGKNIMIRRSRQGKDTCADSYTDKVQETSLF